MSTFPHSPPGRRIDSPPCMLTSACGLRKSLTASIEVCGKRKHRFAKNRFYSNAFFDDPNCVAVDQLGESYLMHFDHLKDSTHPPGFKHSLILHHKGIEFPILSISNFITQVVPKFLPSLDAYKTFICKGLFTTTHAIQIGSMISPVEKAYLEPLVTWHRSYSERFWLPDRNSVPGSTGIGLALSLRTLSTCFFSLRRIIRSTCKSLSRYFHFNFLSIKHTFSSSLHEVLNFGSTELKCSFLPTAQEY